MPGTGLLTYLARVAQHDFWGLPLSHPLSHGSFRPLTVASLALDVRAGCWMDGSARALNSDGAGGGNSSKIGEGGLCASSHALLRASSPMLSSVAEPRKETPWPSPSHTSARESSISLLYFFTSFRMASPERSAHAANR